MQIRITPKTKGNRVNVRAGMSGKRNGVVTTTLADGTILDAETTRNENWFKVEDGYVRSELCTVIPTEIKVEEPEDEE